MSKQSSIDWFMAEYSQIYYEMETNEISKKEFAEKHFELVQQSKEMHKEELIEFGNDCLEYMVTDWKGQQTVGEEYYQETYGGDQ